MTIPLTGVEVSYLGAWAVVATVLVGAGGLGLLLAPMALVLGAHRAHLWAHPRNTWTGRASRPSHPRGARRAASVTSI